MLVMLMMFDLWHTHMWKAAHPRSIAANIRPGQGLAPARGFVWECYWNIVQVDGDASICFDNLCWHEVWQQHCQYHQAPHDAAEMLWHIYGQSFWLGCC